MANATRRMRHPQLNEHLHGTKHMSVWAVTLHLGPRPPRNSWRPSQWHRCPDSPLHKLLPFARRRGSILQSASKALVCLRNVTPVAL